MLYILVRLSSQINHHFLLIFDNPLKKCFEQRLVNFLYTTHLNIKNVQELSFSIKSEADVKANLTTTMLWSYQITPSNDVI